MTKTDPPDDGWEGPSRNALRQLGADLHHTEFPGVAHDAWTPTLTDPDFHRWLNAHLFPNPENTP